MPDICLTRRQLLKTFYDDKYLNSSFLCRPKKNFNDLFHEFFLVDASSEECLPIDYMFLYDAYKEAADVSWCSREYFRLAELVHGIHLGEDSPINPKRWIGWDAVWKSKEAEFSHLRGRKEYQKYNELHNAFITPRFKKYFVSSLRRLFSKSYLEAVLDSDSVIRVTRQGYDALMGIGYKPVCIRSSGFSDAKDGFYVPSDCSFSELLPEPYTPPTLEELQAHEEFTRDLRFKTESEQWEQAVTDCFCTDMHSNLKPFVEIDWDKNTIAYGIECHIDDSTLIYGRPVSNGFEVIYPNGITERFFDALKEENKMKLEMVASEIKAS